MAGETQKRAIVAGGPLQDAIRVKVMSESGQGQSVLLEDGTELLLKPTVVDVWRFLDVFDGQGLPIYQLQAGLVTSTVKIGEGLSKK
jgi:hypothetical protein